MSEPSNIQEPPDGGSDQRLVRRSGERLIWVDPPEPHDSRVIERKPCPFCGSSETGLTHLRKMVVVTCLNCGAHGPPLEDQTESWRLND
ncbi:MAG: Lar family restriction alleviation protein, partial [Gloeobacteraceae cyanobacterium ES-bin-144]|nr:Lar family restriction alleviation protein [Verrucomicrobiales bacterium]